jgi:hypothetical protein
MLLAYMQTRLRYYSLSDLIRANTSFLGPEMSTSASYMHWQGALCGYLAGAFVGCNGPHVERICTIIDAINTVLGREIDSIDPSILHGVCEWDATLCFLALYFHACLWCENGKLSLAVFPQRSESMVASMVSIVCRCCKQE